MLDDEDVLRICSRSRESIEKQLANMYSNNDSLPRSLPIVLDTEAQAKIYNDIKEAKFPMLKIYFISETELASKRMCGGESATGMDSDTRGEG